MAGPYKPKPAYKPGGRKPDPRLQDKKDENELRINREITAPMVRLVGDNVPEPGIVPIAKALQLADQLELDLVEISAKADPPYEYRKSASQENISFEEFMRRMDP